MHKHVLKSLLDASSRVADFCSCGTITGLLKCWALASIYSTLSRGLSLSPSSVSLSPLICYRISIFCSQNSCIEILNSNRMVLGSF